MSDRGTPGKPSHHEDEYFVREDAEKKRKLALHAKKEMEAAELKRLKELHFMRCPKCGLALYEIKYKGIDVDVCFACHGVFLDQVELEAITRHESHGVVEAILNWFKPETSHK
jgi:Zn-finger nucleic acid-binding protein